MKIATLLTQANDTLTGTIHTLTMNSEVTFKPSNSNADKAPAFHIYAGTTEIGAAWLKETNDGKPYHSVTLDDPSFTRPLYLAMFAEKDAGKFALVWDRPQSR